MAPAYVWLSVYHVSIAVWAVRTSLLAVGVLSLLALVEERGKGDRGEDADDQDDDQELDEREALLVLGALAKLVEHVGEPS